MSERCDAVVVGAGVMGASTAMHLASVGLKVLLLEKAPGPGFGSTGKSVAGIRQTYSHFEMTLLAREALNQFQNWRDFTGLEAPKAGFKNSGFLFLLSATETSMPALRSHHLRAGVESHVLDAKQIRSQFPDISSCGQPLNLEDETHDCIGGVQGLWEPQGGFADPVGTAEDMLAVARREGAQVRFNVRVTEVHQAGGRITGVKAQGPGGALQVDAPVVVNCAGPWAPGLNALAGVRLRQELVPTRIQVLTKRHPERLSGRLPFVGDMVTGIYFRPEASGSSVILGSLREEDEREAVTDLEHYVNGADTPFRERQLTLLHHRVSTFHARGDVSSYAGLYTVNREDSHPVMDQVGPQGFYPVCGFSGHGFKISPMVGTLVTRRITGQWGRVPSGVPLEFFAADRTPLKTTWGGVIA